jgi:predicted TIM-barrel fold metal-dependent hydrolase
MTAIRHPQSAAARTDHNALIGPYPFRHLPDPSAARLLADMDRLSIGAAWVGHLPSIWYRDVAAGNDELFRLLASHRDRLLPVPAVNPSYPDWEREIARARREGAGAVRTYPSHFDVPCAGAAMAELAAACAEAGLVLTLMVRLEDGRQRHRLDVAHDLIGADVRAVVRSHPRVQVLVTCGDRALVEEVHFGSTAEEAARVRYDVSWIWGPPEDHLALLMRTVGRERFVFGSHFPLRLPENAVAKMDLLAAP